MSADVEQRLKGIGERIQTGSSEDFDGPTQCCADSAFLLALVRRYREALDTVASICTCDHPPRLSPDGGITVSAGFHSDTCVHSRCEHALTFNPERPSHE